MFLHRQRAGIRRSATISVEAIEERTTPTAFVDVAPAPEMVQAAPVSAAAHEASIRTDLFGVGETSEDETVAWEDWWGECVDGDALVDEAADTRAPPEV